MKTNNNNNNSNRHNNNRFGGGEYNLPTLISMCVASICRLRCAYFNKSKDYKFTEAETKEVLNLIFSVDSEDQLSVYFSTTTENKLGFQINTNLFGDLRFKMFSVISLVRGRAEAFSIAYENESESSDSTLKASLAEITSK